MIFKNWSCERIFLVVAMIVGTILIFLTPPMCTPDENCHFLNSYAFSTGQFTPSVKDGEVGKYIRNDIINFVDGYNGKYSGKYDEKYTFQELYFNSHLQVTDRKESFYSSRLLSGNPFAYIFSTAGIICGKFILRLWGSGFDTPYNLLVFARMGNFIFFIIAGYIGLKNSVCMKKTILVILTMPMTLCLGSSVSYDAILIAGAILYFSNFMRIYLESEEYRINKIDIIQMLICVFVFTAIKQMLIPFLLLLFLIEINKFENKKKYIGCIVGVLLVGVICYLLPTIVNINCISESVDSYSAITLQQKEYVMSNPLNFLLIILRTLKEQRIFYSQGFYGSLGLQDTNFPIPILVLGLVNILIISINDVCHVKKINVKCRIITLVALIICIVGMYYGTYLAWSCRIVGVGGNTVTGIQGRYFIPVYLFVFIIFMNSYLNKKIKFNNIINVFVEHTSELLVIASMFMTPLIIFIRYWC